MKSDEKHNSSRVTIFILFSAFLFLSVAFNIYFAIGLRTLSFVSLSAAENITGMDFSFNDIRMLEPGVKENKEAYIQIRDMHIPNSVAPAMCFNPLPPGFKIASRKALFQPSEISGVKRPENLDDVAFWPILKLAKLIRTGQVSSVELCSMYIDRLKKYGDSLHCIITLTEGRAMDRAHKADAEIASGTYKGLLHGLPCGVKDLLAMKGYPTTWGAVPYREQIIDEDAAVIHKLEEAGAVVVAKLSMGALAWGDVWFDGTTRNPWNKDQGSSGSSAGSASATSAGLIAFSIGTETWGSIVSPAARCRVTGFRPSFGRVSRTGAMALSWSMDKIGPICRSVEGCAAVFNAINGIDDEDMSLIDIPFSYKSGQDLSKMRIGYLKSAIDNDSINQALYARTFEIIRAAGGKPMAMEWPEFPVNSLSFILNAEAAAAFDDLTLSHQDDLLTRQQRMAWPNVFRQARFIPAVEYIQAMRARTLLMMQTAEVMKDFDVIITPAFGGATLLLSNLTGHPAVVVPAGVDKDGRASSLTFIGQLFEDGKALQVAHVFQKSTNYHSEHPDMAAILK
ncbi:amidase [bacterium]|nr:amidase [bacterium]